METHNAHNKYYFMKNIITLATILFISLLSSPSWSETMEDLVVRNDLWYKKFTDIPFTGEISGRRNGKFKNGERNGLWEWYRYNGDLVNIGNYKDGRKDGIWQYYHRNGQLDGRGNYKNGYREGIWVIHNKDGTLKETRSYKDGELVK